MQPFSVNFWGSDPEDSNDDCWSGLDFTDLGGALLAYTDEALAHKRQGVFVEIDGPGISGTRRSTFIAPTRHQVDLAWRLELANEAGMAFGCDGFNDTMGY